MRPAPIVPVATPTSQPFWDALAERRVEIQRCDDCSSWVFYPRVRCAGCLSSALTWTEVSGEGTVYTFTVARQPTTLAFADVVIPIIAVVELDEGPRLTTSLESVDPADVRVGMRVQPVFVDAGYMTLLRHQPMSETRRLRVVHAAVDIEMDFADEACLIGPPDTLCVRVLSRLPF